MPKPLLKQLARKQEQEEGRGSYPPALPRFAICNSSYTAG